MIGHSKLEDEFSAEEAAKRRDEVVRRMANTPPQPHVKTPAHPKTRKKAATGHASRGKQSAPKP